MTTTIDRFRVTTSELSLSASLAAVYIITTFIPLTPFIGGPVFITLEIVMLPIIAFLLRPLLAGVTIFVGSVGMALLQTSIYSAFGPIGLFIPIIATILGSIAFHHRVGPIAPWSYVLLGAVYYLLFSRGGTILWLAPYVIVIASVPLVLKVTGNLRTGFLSFYTAMSEQVTMNILSIAVLGLVGGVWTIITPLMFSERTVATLGGAAIIVALKSRLGERLEASLKRVGR